MTPNEQLKVDERCVSNEISYCRQAGHHHTAAVMEGLLADWRRVKEEYEQIAKRISELAVVHSPDYPHLDQIKPFEKLWALECSLRGTNLALNDWEKECDQEHERADRAERRELEAKQQWENWERLANENQAEISRLKVAEHIRTKDVISELLRIFGERTGSQPIYSFYSWLDALGVHPSEECWKHIIDHPDEYEWPTHSTTE